MLRDGFAGAGKMTNPAVIRKEPTPKARRWRGQATWRVEQKLSEAGVDISTCCRCTPYVRAEADAGEGWFMWCMTDLLRRVPKYAPAAPHCPFSSVVSTPGSGPKVQGCEPRSRERQRFSILVSPSVQAAYTYP